MLKIKNLTKYIRGDVLFKEVSFTIGNKQRVALIGPNGCGKSTLMKMIIGIEEIDDGQIMLEKEVIGYLPQEFSFDEYKTVGDYFDSLIADKTKQHLLEKILSRLGLQQLSRNHPINSSSEGQKMKLKLAQILLNQPTILLLDEPTNHLDIDGLLWFEKFINEFDGSVLMISHDRAFMNHTATHIYEIDEYKLHMFVGNYSDYVNQKETWIEHRDRMYKAQERKRSQLEQLMENAQKIKDGKKRGKALRAAEKRMEREVTTNEINQYERYGIDGIDFTGQTHKDKLILRVDHLSHQYGNHDVLKEVSFEIRGTERVWLFGRNGAGKSTLLNIITKHLHPTNGKAEIGLNVRWGYFQQNQKHLPTDVRVDAYIHKELSLQPYQALNFLQKLNFTDDHMKRTLGQLSPGERARLTIAIFTTKEFDFLILDEPTNHLDIWTKQAIEEALQEYKGALLLVSHDRYFVKNVAVEKIMNLSDQKLKIL
ncbi:ABC-F family ATP-binding cassette domain-containing protein [candidate division WWE3 bacterium]|nr:ABC-F family ATP-binding cassette domain-containing protein [candidate division WWE3 bacterium]